MCSNNHKEMWSLVGMIERPRVEGSEYLPLEGPDFLRVWKAAKSENREKQEGKTF